MEFIESVLQGPVDDDSAIEEKIEAVETKKTPPKKKTIRKTPTKAKKNSRGKTQKKSSTSTPPSRSVVDSLSMDDNKISSPQPVINPSHSDSNHVTKMRHLKRSLIDTLLNISDN